MKINDIILKEELDQKEADMVYQGLIASGEEYDKMVAREFQITRNDPRHTSGDTAQQAAETRARNKMKKSIDKIKKAEDAGNLTIDSGTTFNLNGQDITNATGTFSNAGTIQVNGSETNSRLRPNKGMPYRPGTSGICLLFFAVR